MLDPSSLIMGTALTQHRPSFAQVSRADTKSGYCREMLRTCHSPQMPLTAMSLLGALSTGQNHSVASVRPTESHATAALLALLDPSTLPSGYPASLQMYGCCSRQSRSTQRQVQICLAVARSNFSAIDRAASKQVTRLYLTSRKH